MMDILLEIFIGLATFANLGAMACLGMSYLVTRYSQKPCDDNHVYMIRRVRRLTLQRTALVAILCASWLLIAVLCVYMLRAGGTPNGSTSQRSSTTQALWQDQATRR